jgi:hypothetical protein
MGIYTILGLAIKMKNLLLIILISFLFIGGSCSTPGPYPEPDCQPRLDSLTKYWIGQLVSLKLEIIDSVSIKDSINWIDSVRWSYQDSIRWTYSHFIDTSYVKLDTNSFYEIPIDTIRVDSSYTVNYLNNLLDDSLYVNTNNHGTRWFVKGYPHQAMIIFDTSYLVTEIWINVFKWNEGYYHDFIFYHWGDLLDSVRTKSELWSKHKVYYVGRHLYIEVLGGLNSWTDIAGIKIFGYRKGSN